MQLCAGFHGHLVPGGFFHAESLDNLFEVGLLRDTDFRRGQHLSAERLVLVVAELDNGSLGICRFQFDWEQGRLMVVRDGSSHPEGLFFLWKGLPVFPLIVPNPCLVTSPCERFFSNCL
jgi:hypothetical protein